MLLPPDVDRLLEAEPALDLGGGTAGDGQEAAEGVEGIGVARARTVVVEEHGIGLQSLDPQGPVRLGLDEGLERGVGLGGLASARQVAAGRERGVEGLAGLGIDRRGGGFGDGRPRLDVLEGRGRQRQTGDQDGGPGHKEADAARAGEEREGS